MKTTRKITLRQITDALLKAQQSNGKGVGKLPTPTSIRTIAPIVGVAFRDLHAYINGRRHKVGAEKRRIIRKWLIGIGIVPAPKLRPRCTCTSCGKVHIQDTQRARGSQSKTAEKKFATESQR